MPIRSDLSFANAEELYEGYLRRSWWFAWYRLRAYLCLFYFGFFLVLSYPFFRWALARPQRYPLAHRCRRFWARSIAWIFGLRIRLEGGIPDGLKKTVVVANHFSYLDIPVLVAALPLDLHFVAKSELLRIPLLRDFFGSTDIAIPRHSAQGSLKAYEQCGAMLNPGSAVVVFPEGGIWGVAPRMAAFKVAPFGMALQQGVTLLPVSLPDTWKLLPECPRHFLRPGLCRVRLLEPVDTATLYPGGQEADYKALKNLCYQRIQSDLNELHPSKPAHES